MTTTYEIFKAIAMKSSPISGDTLGRQFDMSRAAVFKHIEKLRSAGVQIDSSKAGYSYIPNDCLSVYTLAFNMEKLGLPLRCIVKICDSTNSEAKREALNCSSDFVIAAPLQTKGKGRINRGFESNLGGVYFSLCLHPYNMYPSDGLKSVLMCAVAVAKTLEKLGFEPSIKWPNDVYVNGKKICGILAESSICGEKIEYFIFGIGINVNNSFKGSLLEDVAISLFDIDGKTRTREAICAEVCVNLASLIDEYQAKGFENILAYYISKTCSIGRQVSTTIVDKKISGFAKGLTPEGFLILDSNGEEIIVHAGDVYAGD